MAWTPLLHIRIVRSGLTTMSTSGLMLEITRSSSVWCRRASTHRR
jgi:hypothetical protein